MRLTLPEHITGSPVVTMNRAIAVAELAGPQAALTQPGPDHRFLESRLADFSEGPEYAPSLLLGLLSPLGLLSAEA